MADRGVERLSIDTIRGLAMEMVQRAGSGHPGTAMALAPPCHGGSGWANGATSSDSTASAPQRRGPGAGTVRIHRRGHRLKGASAARTLPQRVATTPL